MQMVVAKGFGNASISEIAKKAGVAEGYLYRYYKGKTELVEDLLYTNLKGLMDKLEDLLESNHTIGEIFDRLIRTVVSMAKENPERIKFLHVMMNDYNFKIEESQRMRIFSLCKKAKEKGCNSGDIHPEITEEEIYLLGVSYPIQFINLRLKAFFDQSDLNEPEIQKIIRVCRNSLKYN